MHCLNSCQLPARHMVPKACRANFLQSTRCSHAVSGTLLAHCHCLIRNGACPRLWLQTGLEPQNSSRICHLKKYFFFPFQIAASAKPPYKGIVWFLVWKDGILYIYSIINHNFRISFLIQIQEFIKGTSLQ